MIWAGWIRRCASRIAIRRTSWIDQRISGGVAVSVFFLGAPPGLPGGGSDVCAWDFGIAGPCRFAVRGQFSRAHFRSSDQQPGMRLGSAGV